MNRVIYSKEFNPYYNLSLEEDLLKTADEDMLLFIWQNDKTVVVGRNQNPYSECNLKYAKEETIKIARRISGGGAVFHDKGNVNYTFITKGQNADVEKQLSVVLNAVKCLGINAVFSGRNDLLVDDRKFSGQAYYTEDGNYFHHGTIMVDVNRDMASKVLTPSVQKLKSKGISSIKSRVVNLCDINPYIKTTMVINAMVESFTKIYGSTTEAVYFNEDNYIPTQISKHKSEDWIFGESPQFEITLEKLTSLGTLSVNLNVENGIIKAIKIYSDFLNKLSFEKEESFLVGKKFDEDKIFDLLLT